MKTKIRPGMYYEYTISKDSDQTAFWLCTEYNDKDAFGISTEIKYRFDYPCDINMFKVLGHKYHIGSKEFYLYKPKKLIPFSTLLNSIFRFESTLDFTMYDSHIKVECDRYDDLVRGYNGTPFIGAFYELKREKNIKDGVVPIEYFAICEIVASKKTNTCTIGGYEFDKTGTGSIYHYPRSEFDNQELKLFTDSGNIPPKFIGMLSSHTLFELKKKYKQQYSLVSIEEKDILCDENNYCYPEPSIIKELTRNGNKFRF